MSTVCSEIGVPAVDSQLHVPFQFVVKQRLFIDLNLKRSILKIMVDDFISILQMNIIFRKPIELSKHP